MKRIRNNPSVLLAPCNAWGKEKGPRVEGVARSVEDEPTAEAEVALHEKYRVGLRLFHLFGQRQIGKVVLEISPADSEDEPR